MTLIWLIVWAYFGTPSIEPWGWWLAALIVAAVVDLG